MNNKMTRRQRQNERQMEKQDQRRNDRQNAGAVTPVEQGFWSPVQQLNRLRNEIDRLFGSPMQGLLAPAANLLENWGPSVDLREDKEKYDLRAELPGVRKEDIEVSVEGNTLTIAGEKRQEEQEGDEGRGTYRAERFFGRFQRSITLPTVVDPNKIEAQYRDGVLILNLPKSEEARRKQIQVKGS